MGMGVTGKDCHHAYQDVNTSQQATSAPHSEDFEADPVFQGRERGGGKVHFLRQIPVTSVS